MHTTCLIVWFILILVFTKFINTTILRCSQNDKPKSTKYYFVAPCTRSVMKLIATHYYDNLSACKKFAHRKRGFAINFVHKELLHPMAKNFSGQTCLVYDCPEFDVQISWETNTVYDYYSAYARPMPNTNVSCIPKLGIFQLHKVRSNYTEAEMICNEEGGALADISTRLHTEQLASLMATERIKEAYVGLNRLEYPGEFLNSRGYPLNCLNYRAWAPGEPKPKENAKCTTLTSKMQWKISDCSIELPFLCELVPNGPYRPCQRFYTLRRKQRCLEIFKTSLPRTNRFPKCGDPDYFEMADKKKSNRDRKRNRHY